MKPARRFACARCVLQGATMSASGRWLALLLSSIFVAGVGGAMGPAPSAFAADDLRSEDVRASIGRAVDFLRSQQSEDGSFLSSFAARTEIRVTRRVNGKVVSSTVKSMHAACGPTALATLALLNAGVGVDDPSVARALEFLRGVRERERSSPTYEDSLLLMVFVAARQWEKDRSRMEALAKRLEAVQTTRGAERGMWSYGHVPFAGDNSNTQFAVLGLHDAALAGVHVKRKTWEMALDHFLHGQSPDGGWGYGSRPGHSTGSMTCSGIGSLVICQQMLSAQDVENADGTPKCCDRKAPFDRPLRRGVNWLEQHFLVDRNPGSNWLFYYLYGVERAGRLSAQRFFGQHDWYREGVRFLLSEQSAQDGSWSHSSASERDKVLASSFALLFLSKGLAPVLINKLNYASTSDRSRLDDTLPNWNRHPNDVRNLTEHITTLPHWPRLLTFQEVEMRKALAAGRAAAVGDLLQAPILYLSGTDDPNFSEAQVRVFRAYLDQGGFILAVNNCHGSGFDRGIRNLAAQLFPAANAALKRLPPDHAIYKAEYDLDPAKTELWGAEFGCRTSFVYSPEDLSCLWDNWPMTGAIRVNSPFGLTLRHSMRVGVNVVAFATGRELHDKLDLQQLEAENPAEANRDAADKRAKIQRGLLQVAKLRHTGDWDAAPQALHKVLVALNRMSGVVASTAQQNLVPGDGNLPTFPLTYMHGRSAFKFSPSEVENLRKYLDGGAVLFADACCGSPQFDQSMRELVRQLFPEQKLAPIPVTHELFSPGIGFDIRTVKRRIPQNGKLAGPLNPAMQDGEPVLEGIQLKGRYCVIYSKFDISCAVERQASVGCAGYDSHDAVRIFVNVIRYALLQDIAYADQIR
jgi:hypothetical protein